MYTFISPESTPGSGVAERILMKRRSLTAFIQRRYEDLWAFYGFLPLRALPGVLLLEAAPSTLPYFYF